MLRCMRTTVNLDDQLLAEAKSLVRSSGTTLTAVIQDALRERLARRHAAPGKGAVRLRSHHPFDP